MGVEEHKKEAAALGPINCAVLVISDTRGEAEDLSGKRMVELLAQAGHKVVAYKIMGNNPELVKSAVQEQIDGEADLILTTGGTGLSKKDSTIEAIGPLLDKVLPGFGELFRRLSYDQVGSAAFMSRALMGLLKGKILVCLPGSPKAVELALTRLIVPELHHLIWEARR